MKKLLLFVLLISGLPLAASEDLFNHYEDSSDFSSFEKDCLLSSASFLAWEINDLEDGTSPGLSRTSGYLSSKVFNFRDPEVHYRLYIHNSQFIEPGLDLFQIIFPFHTVF